MRYAVKGSCVLYAVLVRGYDAGSHFQDAVSSGFRVLKLIVHAVSSTSVECLVVVFQGGLSKKT